MVEAEYAGCGKSYASKGMKKDTQVYVFVLHIQQHRPPTIMRKLWINAIMLIWVHMRSSLNYMIVGLMVLLLCVGICFFCGYADANYNLQLSESEST